MNITQFGRVEIDPMLIPASVATEQDSGVSFAEALEKTFEQQDAAEESSARAEKDSEMQPGADEAEPDAEPQDKQSASEQNADTDKSTGQDARAAEAMPREGDEKAETKNPEAGAPVRRENAGKGAGAPASHLSNTEIPEDGAAHSGDASSKGLIGSVASMTAASGTQANNVNVTRPTSANFEEIGASLRFEKSSAAAGYRSTTKQALELAEAARDSVFKQIAMNLTPEGGEMVMLLDPPELGKLDIRLTIESGNVARLSIGAERPELAAMLEKHMAELREHLESQGITVDSAEVYARKENNQGQTRQDGKHQNQGDADDADDASNDPWARVRANPGFITADGIQIWA